MKSFKKITFRLRRLMINFDDLPCDIKSKIYKINKDREREEHWELMMDQVKQKAIVRSQTKRASLYSTGRDPSDVTFMIREDRNLVHNDMEYRTHWDFRGDVKIQRLWLVTSAMAAASRRARLNYVW